MGINKDERFLSSRFMLNCIKRFGQGVLVVLGFLAIYYLVNKAGQGESMNFDFKKATDVEQRLDDVKGIDEIKTEVLNIIKVI